MRRVNRRGKPYPPFVLLRCFGAPSLNLQHIQMGGWL